MPPRTSKQSTSSSTVAAKTLVIDNGAYEIKAGIAAELSDIPQECHLIPNCIARGPDGPRATKVYVGDQLESCKDFAEMVFRRPVEKGYVVNWEGELDVWKQSFFNDAAKLRVEPEETNLLLTEAPNCPQALQHNADQIIFEELEFTSAYRCVGSSLNYYNDLPSLFGRSSQKAPEGILVVDSGYSHTTITPLIYGRPVQTAIRRIDVGGRLLTNRMKELISLRQINLMDETHLVNQIKEDTCFVSQDFRADLEQSWRPIKRKIDLNDPLLTTGQSVMVDYVLPDYHTTFRGRVKPHEPRVTGARLAGKGSMGDSAAMEDACVLGNERFTVPELLFAPSDIDMAQAGLPEAVVQSLRSLPVGLWPVLLANVLLVGGNTKTMGFVERFESDLRSLVPSECPVEVRHAIDPVTYTWLGGSRLASNQANFRKYAVTRDEYLENGPHWTAKRYAQPH